MNEEQNQIVDDDSGNGQTNPEDQKQPSGENMPNNGRKSYLKKAIIITLALIVVGALFVAGSYYLKKNENDSEGESSAGENSEVTETQVDATDQKRDNDLENLNDLEFVELEAENANDDPLLLQKEIARSAVPGVTICLDQGGYVEDPGERKPICRDNESLGTWSEYGELEPLGGSWGGCELKIGRDPIGFEYCITLSSGQIFGCTEGGCRLREEPASTGQVSEAEGQAGLLLETQNRASEICWAKIEQFGDTMRAREEAVEEIKKLPGAKDAGISSDGSVWIDHVDGTGGIISLNPPGTL